MDNNEKLGLKDILWDLKKFYNDIDDPEIKKDLNACVENSEKFYENYNNKISGLSPDALSNAIKELEALYDKTGSISCFAFLLFSINTTDPKYGAFYQSVKEINSQIAKNTFFFEHQWTNLDDEAANKFLTEDALKEYHHYLAALRKFRPYLLSEAEEKILIEFSPVTLSSWIGLFDKIRSQRLYGRDKRSEEMVLSDLYLADREKRKIASEEFTEGLKEDLPISAHIFNTTLGLKNIDDRLRKYPSWVSQMNLYNEIDDETVDALISAVTSKFDIVEGFYNIKKDILGYDTLYDYDRYAPLPFGDEDEIHWKNCKEIILDCFNEFSGKMADTAKLFFENNWIHAPVYTGKMSGAFSHPTVPSKNPYILVNYTGNLRDVETVAHELGHGIHQYLSAPRGYLNSQHPLTLAETASVFAEILVYDRLKNNINDPKKKLKHICSKIESVFATVFRQISMNRFEERIHTHRRQKGELFPDDLSMYWLETQRAMFGNSVTLTDNYGVWWGYIGHFVHLPGYVYAYAFGEILVLSLYSLYKKGLTDFVPKYIDLLSAGSIDNPYKLLEPFGINLKDTEFWINGLDLINDMVKEAKDISEDLKDK